MTNLLHRLSPIPFIKRNFLVLLGMTLTTTFISLFYIVTLRYTIDTIVIKHETRGEVKGLSTWNNKNLLLVNADEIERELKAQNPSLKTIDVQKKYPNTLHVSFTQQTPFVYLEADKGFFLMAEDGTIVEKVTEEPLDLPKIVHYQVFNYLQYQAGRKVELYDVQTTLELAVTAQDLGYDINEIAIENVHTVVLKQYEDNSSIEMSLERDTEKTKEQLKTVLQQFAIKGISFHVLNLRFERPIIELY